MKLKHFWSMVVLMLLPFWVRANYVRIMKDIEVTSVASGVATLEFRLAWDNSWRDDFNWDAVWVFLKYKSLSASGTGWQPVYLQASGHTVDSSYTCVPGQTGGNVTGVFVYRRNAGNGKSAVKCQLKWRLPAAYNGYTKDDFDERKIIFFVQAIEMVFVPFKAFSLGDGVSADGFGQDNRDPDMIDSEEARTQYYWEGDPGVLRSVGLGAAYPKGYKGGYIMKYELSQEQYVNFLNTLTRAEQEQLLPFVTSVAEGSYLFGRPESASYRNGIVLARRPDDISKPLRFANDLSRDGTYDEDNDGQTIACNYMSPVDLLAYSAWAGLRPMSELEYEKASRRLYPQEPEKGEFAWNNSVAPVFAQSIGLSGRRNEKASPVSSNVNAGGRLGGPVRCGIFARSSGRVQQLSGGSYWGVMELSGNLRELCYNVNAGNVFDGAVHGAGVFSLSLWGNEITYFGVRGGCFLSEADALRTSDRSEVNYYRSRELFYRDSTVGIRCYRQAEVASVNPGNISCMEGNVVCPGLLMHIESKAPAGVIGMENVPLEYMWYVDGKLVEGEIDEELRYGIDKSFTGPRNIVIKRRAVTAFGEASVSITVRIPENPFPSPSQLLEDPSARAQVTMSSDWQNNVKHFCWLEGAPAGISVDNNGLLIGLPNTYPLFTVKVSYQDCPDVMFEKEIRIARNYTYQWDGYYYTFRGMEEGTYLFECYGGAGGRGRADGGFRRQPSSGGKAWGELDLTGGEVFYLYPGGKGQNGAGKTGGAGGGNGGAKGGNDTRDNDPGGGGGGGTDVRLSPGNLYSRVMVAGGGGGGSYGASGGSGGGVYGGSGGSAGTSGASQTTGYALGKGSAGTANKNTGGGGGAGGYMGSTGAKGQGNGTCSAGGGSGFVSGYSGCNAVDASGNFTGQPKHYSGVVFFNPGMSNGVWSGDGKVRIERKK